MLVPPNKCDWLRVFKSTSWTHRWTMVFAAEKNCLTYRRLSVFLGGFNSRLSRVCSVSCDTPCRQPKFILVMASDDFCWRCCSVYSFGSAYLYHLPCPKCLSELLLLHLAYARVRYVYVKLSSCVYLKGGHGNSSGRLSDERLCNEHNIKAFPW